MDSLDTVDSRDSLACWRVGPWALVRIVERYLPDAIFLLRVEKLNGIRAIAMSQRRSPSRVALWSGRIPMKRWCHIRFHAHCVIKKHLTTFSCFIFSITCSFYQSTCVLFTYELISQSRSITVIINQPITFRSSVDRILSWLCRMCWEKGHAIFAYRERVRP